MAPINIRTERKILDSGVVMAAAVASYLTGYIQVLELGAITPALTLPNLFLLGMAFIHLVFRKGRKFDENAHDPFKEILKAFTLILTAYTAYSAGISATENLMPQNTLMLLLALVSTAAAVYITAYRPNK